MNNRVDLVAGQNCPLSTPSLHILVSHGTCPQGMELDVSAFLLNAQGKVSTDDDFIFFNQPAKVEQGILLEPEQGRFTLHLERTSSDVQKISLAMTITDGASKGQNFSQLNSVTVLVKDFLTGMEIACFTLDTSPNQETALILTECYRHQGNWKFRAIGQGFVGGLQPLAEHFGVDVSEAENSSSATAESPLPDVTPVKLNLSKVTLEKKGQSISLDKQAGELTEIMVNLNWNATPVKSVGFFRKAEIEGIDLDLACLWEFEQGEIGATQALGGHFGNFHSFPFIDLEQVYWIVF